MKTLPLSHPFLSTLAGVVLGLFSTAAFAADDKLSSSEKSFIKDAYESGLTEIAAGKLGQEKAVNADVKSFAQMMVTDHEKANTELKAIADAKGVKLDFDAKAKTRALDSKSAADFDKAFAKQMVKDHEKAVKDFEKASKDVKDAQLKTFVDQTLPKLREHLTHAQGLEAKVGK